jgi:hypothetical protein
MALLLTVATVGTAGVVDGVPTNRYSASPQPQKAISAPVSAVQLQKVVGWRSCRPWIRCRSGAVTVNRAGGRRQDAVHGMPTWPRTVPNHGVLAVALMVGPALAFSEPLAVCLEVGFGAERTKGPVRQL